MWLAAETQPLGGVRPWPQLLWAGEEWLLLSPRKASEKIHARSNRVGAKGREHDSGRAPSPDSKSWVTPAFLGQDFAKNNLANINNSTPDLQETINCYFPTQNGLQTECGYSDLVFLLSKLLGRGEKINLRQQPQSRPRQLLWPCRDRICWFPGPAPVCGELSVLSRPRVSRGRSLALSASHRTRQTSSS